MWQLYNKLTTYLFPAVPRDFPIRRNTRTMIRALHIFSAGTLLGGHIFSIPTGDLLPWLYATIFTGALLLVTDLHATAAVIFEVRGVVVLLKIGLLILIAFFFDARIPLLFIVLLLGVYGSHMPKHIRHKMLLFEKRILPDQRNG